MRVERLRTCRQRVLRRFTKRNRRNYERNTRDCDARMQQPRPSKRELRDEDARFSFANPAGRVI